MSRFSSNFESNSYLSSQRTISLWEIINEKANNFLDFVHVYEGDPLIKKDKYFEQNKLALFKLRKSVDSAEQTINLKMPLIQKKKSCIEFEKAQQKNRQKSEKI